MKRQTAGAICEPIEISRWATWPGRRPADAWWREQHDALRRYPKGRQTAWGIPFLMPASDARCAIAAAARVEAPAMPAGGLSPAVFRGTRRQQWETRNAVLQGERDRIVNHVVFGPLLRLWRKFVNPNLPAA